MRVCPRDFSFTSVREDSRFPWSRFTSQRGNGPVRWPDASRPHQRYSRSKNQLDFATFSTNYPRGSPPVSEYIYAGPGGLRAPILPDRSGGGEGGGGGVLSSCTLASRYIDFETIVPFFSRPPIRARAYREFCIPRGTRWNNRLLHLSRRRFHGVLGVL